MILKNAIKCNPCGDIIESESTHDFKTCSCGRVSVDGGHEYLKRCFQKEGDYGELSETVLTLDEAISDAEKFECKDWNAADCLQVATWLMKLKKEGEN